MWVAITIAKGSLVFMGIQASAVAWMGGFLTAAAGPIGIAILIIIGVAFTYHKRTSWWRKGCPRKVTPSRTSSVKHAQSTNRFGPSWLSTKRTRCFHLDLHEFS